MPYHLPKLGYLEAPIEGTACRHRLLFVEIGSCAPQIDMEQT